MLHHFVEGKVIFVFTVYLNVITESQKNQVIFDYLISNMYKYA